MGIENWEERIFSILYSRFSFLYSTPGWSPELELPFGFRSGTLARLLGLFFFFTLLLGLVGAVEHEQAQHTRHDHGEPR